jgi:hypothetical protein
MVRKIYLSEARDPVIARLGEKRLDFFSVKAIESGRRLTTGWAG